jgi:hypothetical protein
MGHRLASAGIDWRPFWVRQSLIWLFLDAETKGVGRVEVQADDIEVFGEVGSLLTLKVRQRCQLLAPDR